ncbi:MAG: hypothetical protein JJV93_03200 [Alphaproteobacteria bacterium]|nr:hypothetical protein [Alphaproteobacteria bacterium]MBL0718234.1 hypothetical protein [Alphaproteobacteria bacterium]
MNRISFYLLITLEIASIILVIYWATNLLASTNSTNREIVVSQSSSVFSDCNVGTYPCGQYKCCKCHNHNCYDSGDDKFNNCKYIETENKIMLSRGICSWKCLDGFEKINVSCCPEIKSIYRDGVKRKLYNTCDVECDAGFKTVDGSRGCQKIICSKLAGGNLVDSLKLNRGQCFGLYECPTGFMYEDNNTLDLKDDICVENICKLPENAKWRFTKAPGQVCIDQWICKAGFEPWNEECRPIRCKTLFMELIDESIYNIDYECFGEFKCIEGYTRTTDKLECEKLKCSIAVNASWIDILKFDEVEKCFGIWECNRGFILVENINDQSKGYCEKIKEKCKLPKNARWIEDGDDWKDNNPNCKFDCLNGYILNIQGTRCELKKECRLPPNSEWDDKGIWNDRERCFGTFRCQTGYRENVSLIKKICHKKDRCILPENARWVNENVFFKTIDCWGVFECDDGLRLGRSSKECEER